MKFCRALPPVQVRYAHGKEIDPTLGFATMRMDGKHFRYKQI